MFDGWAVWWRLCRNLTLVQIGRQCKSGPRSFFHNGGGVTRYCRRWCRIRYIRMQVRRISVHGSLHPHNGGHGVDIIAYLVGSGVSTAGGEVEIIFPYVDSILKI